MCHKINRKTGVVTKLDNHKLPVLSGRTKTTRMGVRPNPAITFCDVVVSDICAGMQSHQPHPPVFNQDLLVKNKPGVYALSYITLSFQADSPASPCSSFSSILRTGRRFRSRRCCCCFRHSCRNAITPTPVTPVEHSLPQLDPTPVLKDWKPPCFQSRLLLFPTSMPEANSTNPSYPG